VKQSSHALGIEAPMGMGGDMLSAALLGLGASEAGVIDAMTAAGFCTATRAGGSCMKPRTSW
jgi:uncharacterized protein (DUF111 family)